MSRSSLDDSHPLIGRGARARRDRGDWLLAARQGRRRHVCTYRVHVLKEPGGTGDARPCGLRRASLVREDRPAIASRLSVLLLLEPGTVYRSVLHQILSGRLLRTLQLSLLFFFLLTLLGELLLTLLESVITLWQECSRLYGELPLQQAVFLQEGRHCNQ